MATMNDVLLSLHSLEKDAYRNLIGIATEHYIHKKIQYNIVSAFMTKRKNRVEALYDLTTAKKDDNDLTGNYNVFNDIKKNISGKSEDLDYRNGLLGQIVSNDVRTQKNRKKEFNELSSKNSSIITEIVYRLETFKVNMDEILAIIGPSQT